MPLITIDDNNWRQHVDFVGPDGQTRARGGVARDFRQAPIGYLGSLAPPFPRELELMESEIQPRLDALMQNQATLVDIRGKGKDGQMMPSRDQDGRGYCWAHSSVSAMMLARAAQNEPYADLSAYAVACIIKNYRDQGGWSSESMNFLAERGCPTSKFWPQQSVSKANDKPETWANAALHNAILWYDLDPDRMWLQLASCMCRNWPCPVDYNWWSHAICAARMKDYKNKLLTIWNSWGDGWSDQGMGDLKDGKAVANDAFALVIGEPSRD